MESYKHVNTFYAKSRNEWRGLTGLSGVQVKTDLHNWGAIKKQ